MVLWRYFVILCKQNALNDNILKAMSSIVWRVKQKLYKLNIFNRDFLSGLIFLLQMYPKYNL